MSLLFRVVFANECTSTHHKLALDALRHLQDEDAVRWRNLFLYYFDAYLEGSKAPDKKFKDFRNHVLHVKENFWGGALKKADEWYKTTVREIRRGAWAKAAYSAGVLSHYFSDPLMPFHSAQSEEETQIHRAVEWSIAKSYDELQNVLQQQNGYPSVDVPKGEDWLAQMIKQGAQAGNRHYQTIIDHYDFAAGVKDPPSGLDQTIKDAIAAQLGLAAVGFARVLEEIFDEADVDPPKVGLTLAGYLAQLTVPVRWVSRKLSDKQDRKAVQAMLDELQTKGRVRSTLPRDVREVRELHADEVLKVSLDELDNRPLGPLGQQHGQGAEPRAVSRRPVISIVRPVQTDGSGAQRSGTDRNTTPRALPLRWYLKPTDDVVDAPSIGAKTADRLRRLGIHTVQDLLDCDPDQTAKKSPREIYRRRAHC